MVTITTAAYTKPLPRVPTFPDNGSPFVNGFIPPYEDHKSDDDDLVRHECNKRCMMKITKEYSFFRCRTALLQDILLPLPDNGGPFANDSDGTPGKPGEPPQYEDETVATNEK